MKNIQIEWKHLEKDGETCFRCAETGRTVKDFIKQIQTRCLRQGFKVDFKETLLSDSQVCESNSLLFDGKLLEDRIPGIEISENYCGSCTDLTGKQSYCRTVKKDGETYEEIPESLILEATCKVTGCDCRF